MILNVANIAKGFGVDIILDGVTFRVDEREKVALVGRNGAGKTTLLKIVTGQYEPDRGAVQLRQGAKVGYLRQEVPADSGLTVLQEAEASVQRQLDLQARLRNLENAMERGKATAEDLDEYSLLHEHLEGEGYSAERDIRVVLRQMGFEDREFDKPTALLSGGEKTRLALARMLLEEPDLLILDEPTNHLDLQATEWLESWIRNYHGAVLLVSHDRTFLENTADKVVEMREGTVKSYPGSFEKFRRLRAEEDARLTEVARRQDLEIARMDEYVRRFMNSQRTAQARGRQKLMNRLIESRVDAPTQEKGMKAGFQTSGRSGDVVLECERLTVGFSDGETLLRDFNWTVRNGERWGVIGENGAGKSTLLRVALGQMDAVAGRARLGANVTVGYFTQDGRDLDPEMSPLDTMVWDLDMEPGPARDLLGRFLITGDDVYRPIRTLSGGEKNKLSLARLTQLKPNLLVLDEPTNHLDMASREALGEVLKGYPGTLILISHDRWLLSLITAQTLDLKRSGPVQFPGSYAEYRSRGIAKPVSAPPQLPHLAAKPVESDRSPREISKEIARLTRVVATVEEQIAGLENELREIEARLASVDPTADVYQLSLDHKLLKEELEGTISVWEENSRQLESLQSRQGSVA